MLTGRNAVIVDTLLLLMSIYISLRFPGITSWLIMLLNATNLTVSTMQYRGIRGNIVWHGKAISFVLAVVSLYSWWGLGI